MHQGVCVTVPALFDYLFPKLHSFSVRRLLHSNFLGTLAQLSLLGLNTSCLIVQSMSKWLIQNLGPRTGFLLQKMMKQVVGRSRCCMQCFPGKLAEEPQK